MGIIAFIEGKHCEITISGCFEWLMSKDRDGYGKCSTQSYDQFAHRVVAGSPDGVVMHTCDNPSCINPYHLRIGTQLNNVEDCISKGVFKSNSGEDNPRSVLNWNTVDKIRSMYSTGVWSYSSLAGYFGVGKSTVSNIIKENTWRKDGVL